MLTNQNRFVEKGESRAMCTLLIMGWVGIFATHIALRVPWKGVVNHSGDAIKYTLVPAILLILFSLGFIHDKVRRTRDGAHRNDEQRRDGAFTGIVRSLCTVKRVKGEENLVLTNSTKLLVSLSIALGVACTAFATSLDRSRSQKELIGFAIAETICLCSVIILCMALVRISMKRAEATAPGTGPGAFSEENIRMQQHRER